MTIIKKTLALLLALGMVMALAACGTKTEPGISATPVTSGIETPETVIIGGLYRSGQTSEEMSQGIKDSREKAAIDSGNTPVKTKLQMVYFDNLISLLSELNAGRIDRAGLPKCVVEYIAAQNDKYIVKHAGTNVTVMIYFQFGVLDTNTDLLSKFNAAIKTLRENGTLAKLKASYIDGLMDGTEPRIVELPVIDGAETVRVVVTGDLPPLDYVSADGKAAGYNVALLSELSGLMNVNFNLVKADAASRASMLISERADAIYWIRTNKSSDLDGEVLSISDEAPDRVALTDAYFEDEQYQLLLK